MKVILFISSSLFSICLLAQLPMVVNAKMKAATVYFNAVEMSHQANLNLPVGTSEVIVKNVANNLFENTVRISAPSNITILSVQFSNDNFTKDDEISPTVKAIKDSLKIKKNDLSKIENMISSESNTIGLLDSNRRVFGFNSGLSVMELIKMVDYYRTKRTELSNNIDVLQEKQEKLQEAINKLNDRLTDLNSGGEKLSSGKLIVQLMSEKGGPLPIDISYLSPSCSWTPYYDLRAENINSDINLIYKAQVVQYTGVDWKKVKLTLSSGVPNQDNQAPLLTAWRLVYGYQYDLNVRGGRARYDNRNQAMSNTIQAAPVMESATAEGVVISDMAVINDNQLNISFDIDMPYDILSNSKVHSVNLKEMKLPVRYKYYSVPKIEKEAFLLAELSDYSKYNLLRGEANIIFEDMYIGKTMIDPNQTTDTLNLSMGRDKKISVKREKIVDKSGTKFLSSYKSQTFTYDLTLRNGKKEAVDLILKDQYPLSSDRDIEIELLQSDNAKVNTESGVLTWMLKLAPNETKKIRISYSVKYPKDKVIGNL
jgi:uncharacterized protein (TIGR02231 family)